MPADPSRPWSIVYGEEQEGGNTPSLRRGDTEDFVVDRLVNYGNAAEGSILPPRQTGSFRVPLINGLKVEKVLASLGQSVFFLSWQEPALANIAAYNIYYRGAFAESLQLQGPVRVSGSPAEVRVASNSITNITFFVQTELKNGMVSEIELSPSCSGSTLDPTVSALTPGTVRIVDLASGTVGHLISWDAGSAPITIAPGATGTVLTSAGVSAVPAYQTTQRQRQITLSGPAVITGGAPTTDVVDNVNVIQLPDGSDSEINVSFRVPPDAVVAQDIALLLNFRPGAAPGTTNNKVKLITTAKVQNTSASATAGDVITLADNTDWAKYSATNNIVTGSTYATGDLVQVRVKRDTTVANNAAVNFEIAEIAFLYSSTS